MLFRSPAHGGYRFERGAVARAYDYRHGDFKFFADSPYRRNRKRRHRPQKGAGTFGFERKNSPYGNPRSGARALVLLPVPAAMRAPAPARPADRRPSAAIWRRILLLECRSYRVALVPSGTGSRIGTAPSRPSGPDARPGPDGSGAGPGPQPRVAAQGCGSGRKVTGKESTV